MSTMLNQPSAVVPRRRGSANSPLSSSEPSAPEQATDVAPSEDSQQPDSPEANKELDPPVLLRLPDSGHDLTGFQQTAARYRVDEIATMEPVAETDDSGSENGERVDRPSKSAAAAARERRGARRRLSTDTMVNLGEFWQTGKGRLVISGTLLALALLLFSIWGPSGSDGDATTNTDPPANELIDNSLEAFDENPAQFAESPKSDNNEAIDLSVGSQSRTGLAENQSVPSGQPMWDRQPTPVGHHAEPRMADQRGQADGDIPTFKIGRTYSPPSSSQPPLTAPAGPNLNAPTRRPLSLDYHQSRLPTSHSNR